MSAHRAPHRLYLLSDYHRPASWHAICRCGWTLSQTGPLEVRRTQAEAKRAYDAHKAAAR